MRRLMSKVFRGSVWWVGTVAVARWFADSEHGPARRAKARELIAHAGRRTGEALEGRQPEMARRINHVAARVDPGMQHDTGRLSANETAPMTRAL